MNKKIHYKILASVLSLCLCFSANVFTAHAEGSKAYTYTVNFYTGNHGSFASTSHVMVDNSRSGSSYQVSGGGSVITVSGLMQNDVVSFDAALVGAVDLGENSKYYVKGIRQSGRDNNTVSLSAFRVEKDQDYVVAYGIRGELTSYTVNYQDTSGRTLAPSRTYYGNVGDRPVVAFLYIEGYEPQAYNLTRTLTANAAENIFTFEYSRPRSSSNEESGSGSNTTGGGSTSSAPEGGGATNGTTGTATLTTTGAGEGSGAFTGVITPEGGGAADGQDTLGAEDAFGLQEAEDEGVPLDNGPQDLIEEGDEEVPLNKGNIDEGTRLLSSSILIAIVASVALMFLAILWLRRRQTQKTEISNPKDQSKQ